MIKKFGLIGRSLSHSFSKEYFTKKFRDAGLSDCSYDLFELRDISELPAFLARHPDLLGLNVTIPYKQSVMAYLDALSPEASQAGAVNCIRIEDGKTTGHNTDVYGFSQSLKPFLDRHHERALILGTGGASRAVAYVLSKLGNDRYFVTSDHSKKGGKVMLYEDVNEHVMSACKLVVNCTPLGMFPDTGSYPPLPYEFFTPEHLAYDLVYNPAETEFMRRAAHAGAATLNGLSMLQLQAEKSWEIWNGS
jgi:shikimate dehydrogenase